MSIKPVINEISTSTGMIIRNKYIDIFRRSYFINKIYESGIKNIEVGSFRNCDHILFGTRDVIFNINKNISDKRSAFVIDIGSTVKNVSCINSVKPRVEELIYFINKKEDIDEFIKHKIVATQLGMTTKLIIENKDELNCIINETKPDFIEVNKVTPELLKVGDLSKVFIRTNSFEEVDKAIYENIYNFSSSLLKTPDSIDTIELIHHLRNKLGFEVNVSLEKLKVTQKEMHDEFNW
jgi:acyl carrier protein